MRPSMVMMQMESGYTVYNNTSAALRIAPGQAFMVASDNTRL